MTDLSPTQMANIQYQKDIAELRETLQRERDEINTLKGELAAFRGCSHKYAVATPENLEEYQDELEGFVDEYREVADRYSLELEEIRSRVIVLAEPLSAEPVDEIQVDDV